MTAALSGHAQVPTKCQQSTAQMNHEENKAQTVAP